MAEFLVKHLWHNGSQQGEALAGNVSYEISVDGINTVTYDIPLENEMAAWQKTEPYVSDFYLHRNSELFMAGIHTAVGFSSAGNLLQVGGKEWKHWFDRRYWPFDLPDVAVDFNPTYVATGVDTVEIAWDLIEGTSLASTKVVTVTGGVMPLSGLVVDYNINYADEESISSKVDELSKRHPGFDWEITPTKVFNTFVPYRGNDKTDITLEDGINITDSKVNNEGIKASRTYGMGSGNNQKIIKTGEHAGSVDLYRLHEQFVDFGEVSDPDQVQDLATGEDLRSVHGVETITADVIEDNFDFHQNLDIGDVVRVKIPTEYYPSGYLEGDRRIVNVNGQVDNEGNEVISLTFDNSNLAYV